MAKISVGDTFPDLHFATPFKADQTLSSVLPEGKTAVVFLRYYGCPLCQYDMVQYAKQYERILQTGGKLLVVLQSDPEQLRQELGSESAFPFEIVCDPSGALYRQFEILPAANKLKMLGPKTMGKIALVQAAGIQHGRSEGDELQLPAAFIVDAALHVTYAHYAKSVDDVPDTERLVKLLK
jgi:Peroxiredoxin